MTMQPKEPVELLYESDVSNLKIFHEEQYRLLYSTGDVSNEKFKGIFNAILHSMDVYAYKKLLINIGDMKSTTLISRVWLLTQFLPKFYSKYEGSYWVTIVNTKNLLEGITIKLLAKAAMALGFSIVVSFHETVEEALDVLLAYKD